MCVCICKYMCNFFSLCVGCKYFLFVNIFEKKKLLCTLCSNAPFTFECRHGLRSNSLAFVRPQRPISHTHPCTHAFERTLYIRAQSPLHTHTLSTNVIERTKCIRSYAFLALHVTLLGHCPFSFPPFFLPTVQLFLPSPSSLFTQTP
jgi:hypothetical protein